MGRLPGLLDTCTAWAFSAGGGAVLDGNLAPTPGPPAPQAGRERLGRVVQFAGSLLAAHQHAEAGAVRKWWAVLQQRDTQHGQHWLVGGSRDGPGRGGGEGAECSLGVPWAHAAVVVVVPSRGRRTRACLAPRAAGSAPSRGCLIHACLRAGGVPCPRLALPHVLCLLPPRACVRPRATCRRTLA
jgi:hypothetical protein